MLKISSIVTLHLFMAPATYSDSYHEQQAGRAGWMLRFRSAGAGGVTWSIGWSRGDGGGVVGV